MAVNISVLNATGKLERNMAFLDSQIRKSLKVIEYHIEIPDLDITVSPFSKEKVSPFGIGGFALNAHRVEIFLDSTRSDLESVIERELTAVLGHEINHAIRKGHGYKNITLLDDLVMEGLACHFETVINGGEASSMFHEMDEIDWVILYDSMKPLLASSSFPFNELFLGENPNKYPRYAGYWVGYNLVTSYVSDTGTSATELVKLNPKEFILS
ncbi:DUF2268 domain-containing protein [Vibrio kyushuensis]|uniref:DUF2268 domain-containing putative Zn-dependent protease n=1 Tax=Vibrio TaxID=662 RepID=UPI003D106320